METSFDTIPSWLRSGVDRGRYYSRYKELASGLLSPDRNAYFGGAPFLALHARRGDVLRFGQPEDTPALYRLLRDVAARWRRWVVVSDDSVTREQLSKDLREWGCEVITETAGGAPDELTQLRADFSALVAASGVLCSVRIGWSAFPYAATQISGAPLLMTCEFTRARAWRLCQAHSKIPIRGVYFGHRGAVEFLAANR